MLTENGKFDLVVNLLHCTFWTFPLPSLPLHTHRFVTQVSLVLEKMQRSVPSNYCRHYDVLKAIPCAWLITVDSKGHLLLNWLSEEQKSTQPEGGFTLCLCFPPWPPWCWGRRQVRVCRVAFSRYGTLCWRIKWPLREVAAPRRQLCSAGASYCGVRQENREAARRCCCRSWWGCGGNGGGTPGCLQAAMKIFWNHLNELIVDPGVMIEKSKNCKWGKKKKKDFRSQKRCRWWERLFTELGRNKKNIELL